MSHFLILNVCLKFEFLKVPYECSISIAQLEAVLYSLTRQHRTTGSMVFVACASVN